MSVNTLAWYYVPDLDPAAGTALLQEEEWHHARHVMRMQPSDQLIVFNGQGLAFKAEIIQAGKSTGETNLLEEVTSSYVINNPFALAVGFGPTKNIDRTEYAVEKLTEIGVNQITFLDCEHGERTRLRMDRMHKIAVSAAKQSRKLWLPRLIDLVPIHDAVITASRPNMQVMACHLDETSAPLFKNYSPSAGVMLLVGPEGGFSSSEIETMRTANVKFVTLGQHRLRTETATIVAAAQVMILNDMHTL